MPAYQGDGALLLRQSRFLNRDGYNGYRLESALHAGTHIDAPSHLSQSPVQVADMPLEGFWGEGVLLDARDKKSLCVADAEALRLKEGSVLLAYTGMESLYGSAGYYESYPAVSEGFVRVLAKTGVKMLGLDAFSPDYFPFPAHKACFAAGIALLENLCNLGALVGAREFKVAAFPLKIRAEASPVRALAFVEQEKGENEAKSA
jgi:kynurenine formamidase